MKHNYVISFVMDDGGIGSFPLKREEAVIKYHDLVVEHSCLFVVLLCDGEIVRQYNRSAHSH